MRCSPQASLVEELSVEPFHVVNQSDRRFPVAFMEADKMISNCSMYQFFRSVNPSATTKPWDFLEAALEEFEPGFCLEREQPALERRETLGEV